MARPHIAAVVEDGWNNLLVAVLSRRGWSTRVLAYTGYGSVSSIRVLGRVLLSRRRDDDQRAEDIQRGWRAFMTAQVSGVPVTIHVGGRQVDATSDRGGYLDVTVDDHGLDPGWHEVRISAAGAAEAVGSVLVVGSDQTIGLISDIDDTVITTSLPRPMIAFWNTFVRSESARRPVPGMAELYRELLAGHPQAPTFYLSTGAWNTAPNLVRFLRRHGYPDGPLLLTDWGPTNTGWFRSGQEHKRSSLRRLARELPNVRWVLIGDDGQNDPKIYGDFADEDPDRVQVIGLRQLTPTEQVLSHGLPVPNDEVTSAGRRRPQRAAEYRAPDGFGLLPLLRPAVEPGGRGR
jgi:phosphatidate phosphatase APP1